MKAKLITVVFFAASIMMANAQVPDNVRTGFDQKYPNSNATWKVENGNYNAYYTDASKNDRVVSYDKDGQMLYSRTRVTGSAIPGGISTYYTSNYPTESKYDVWMEEDARGTRSYFSVRENNRLYFDGTGNYSRTAPVDMNDPMYDKSIRSNNDDDGRLKNDSKRDKSK